MKLNYPPPRIVYCQFGSLVTLDSHFLNVVSHRNIVLAEPVMTEFGTYITIYLLFLQVELDEYLSRKGYDDKQQSRTLKN